MAANPIVKDVLTKALRKSAAGAKSVENTGSAEASESAAVGRDKKPVVELKDRKPVDRVRAMRDHKLRVEADAKAAQEAQNKKIEDMASSVARRYKDYTRYVRLQQALSPEGVPQDALIHKRNAVYGAELRPTGVLTRDASGKKIRKTPAQIIEERSKKRLPEEERRNYAWALEGKDEYEVKAFGLEDIQKALSEDKFPPGFAESRLREITAQRDSVEADLVKFVADRTKWVDAPAMKMGYWGYDKASSAARAVGNGLVSAGNRLSASVSDGAFRSIGRAWTRAFAQDSNLSSLHWKNIGRAIIGNAPKAFTYMALPGNALANLLFPAKNFGTNGAKGKIGVAIAQALGSTATAAIYKSAFSTTDGGASTGDTRRNDRIIRETQTMVDDPVPRVGQGEPAPQSTALATTGQVQASDPPDSPHPTLEEFMNSAYASKFPSDSPLTRSIRIGTDGDAHRSGGTNFYSEVSAEYDRKYGQPDQQ